VSIVHRDGRWMKGSTGNRHNSRTIQVVSQILDLFPIRMIFTDSGIVINLNFYHLDLFYTAFIVGISVL
jgi:hypothetical protein